MVDEILSEVRESLDLLTSDPDEKNWSETEWTKRVKQTISEVSKKHDFKVYASSVPGVDGGEWLYDISVMKLSKDGGIKQFLLAVESEWIQKRWEIKEDFLKLVVARSDARVMIFQTKDQKQFNDITIYLKSLAKSFPLSQDNDKYLFICWVKEKRGFSYENINLPAI